MALRLHNTLSPSPYVVPAQAGTHWAAQRTNRRCAIALGPRFRGGDSFVAGRAWR